MIRVKLTLPLFLLVLLGVVSLRRWKTAVPPLIALGGVPIVMAAALGVMGVPVFVSRALIPVSIAVCVLLAAGLLSLPTTPRLVLGAAAMALIVTAVVGQLRGQSEDWRAVARYLQPRVAAGEMVVAPTDFLADALRYYWGSTTPVRAWETIGADEVTRSAGVWVVEKSLLVLQRETYPRVLCHAFGDPEITAVGPVLVLHYGTRMRAGKCTPTGR